MDPGLTVFLDPNNMEETTTKLKLNNKHYHLEYMEENVLRYIYFSHYHYYNVIDSPRGSGLEIMLATTHFLLQGRKFYFLINEDRKKLAVYLDHNRTEQRMMTYTNQLSFYCQNREFHALTAHGRMDSEGRLHVNSILDYYKNMNTPVPKELIPQNDCSFEEWQKLYNEMMANSRSSILERIFNRYSIEENNTRLMSEKSLSEFLKNHQKEDVKMPSLSRTMRRHMDNVRLSNKNKIYIF